MFEIAMIQIDNGFSYLDYTLKPNKYGNEGWEWFLQKIKKKLSAWKFKWLSLWDRPTLIKSVMYNMHIYLMHLYILPKEIIHKINKIMDRFVWVGKSTGMKYQLV